MEICINLCSVFLAISHYSQFHEIIKEHQIGALMMDIISLEVKRSEHRIREGGLLPSQIAQAAMDARDSLTELSDR